MVKNPKRRPYLPLRRSQSSSFYPRITELISTPLKRKTSLHLLSHNKKRLIKRVCRTRIEVDTQELLENVCRITAVKKNTPEWMDEEVQKHIEDGEVMNELVNINKTANILDVCRPAIKKEFKRINHPKREGYEYGSSRRKILVPVFEEEKVMIFPSDLKNFIHKSTKDEDCDTDNEEIDRGVKICYNQLLEGLKEAKRVNSIRTQKTKFINQIVCSNGFETEEILNLKNKNIGVFRKSANEN